MERENHLEIRLHMHVQKPKTGGNSEKSVEKTSPLVTPKDSAKGGYKKPSDFLD